MIVVCIALVALAVAPQTRDAVVPGVEDTELRGRVEATALDGGVLTYKVRGSPSRGTVTIDTPTGEFVYRPAGDTNGDDTFTVDVTQGKQSARARVTVRVAAVNDAPLAQPLSLATLEDAVVKGQLVASDVDADKLTYSVKSAAAHGTATLDARSGAVTYKPDADFNGADAFSVVVSDGQLSAEAEVTITVTAVNDAPVANPATFSTDEDTALDEHVEGRDVDGASLSYSLVGKPKHGEATIDPTSGKFHYAPAKDSAGDDSFGFAVSDGKLTAASTVIVHVKPVNDAPVVRPLALTAAEDTVVQGQLIATDLDGPALSYTVKKPGAQGEASVDAKTGKVTFKPSADFNGADAFIVEVADGELTATAEVSVTIIPVNDVPVASAGTFSTDEDTALDEHVQAKDVDGDTLSYSLEGKPKHGEATIEPSSATFHYVPAKDYAGDDSFSFVVSDGKLRATSTVTVHVKPINDAPVARPLSLTTEEDTSAKGQVSAADVDGPAIAYRIKSAAGHGVATVDAKSGNVSYTPARDYNGTDSLSVEVSDGERAAVAEVSVTVVAVNDAPVASAATFGTEEDTPLDEHLDAKDVDGALSYSLGEKPKHGEVTIDAAAGTFHYAPAKDFFGDDSFGFGVSDGKLSAGATITLHVKPVNDVPVVKPMAVTTAEDVLVSAQLVATDVDAPALTYRVKSPATHGGATVDAKRGGVTYKPTADFNGSDAFRVEVSDGSLTAEAEVSVTVTPVNDAPVASAGTFSTDEDTALDERLDTKDVDGDTLTYSLGDKPKHGKVSVDGSSGKFHYAPAKDFFGDDSFGFGASDGKLKANATITLHVKPVNDAPVARPLALTTPEDTPASGQVVATDVDGPALSYRVKSPAAHGDATVDAKRGVVTYKPTADFNGSDTFTVEASDGRLTADAEVSVTVIPVNDAPVASAATFSIDEDTPHDDHLESRDVDLDALTYALGDKPRHGEATVDAAAGTFHYVPWKNFAGDDAFGFVVSDGKVRAGATITLHIKPVDDAPVARPLSVTTAEDTATKAQIAASDLDGPALRYREQTPPLHGTASVNAETGSVTYQPTPDFYGSDAFVVEVSDGQLAANANVTVTVTPVNDLPRTQTTAIEVKEDTPIEAKLPGYDVDGDKLTFHILSAPRLGTAVLTNANSGEFNFTPGTDLNGGDAFEFDVSDGTATVKGVAKIDIVGVNDPPTVAHLSLKTLEDTAVEGQVVGTDVDRDALTYAVASEPRFGTATMVDAQRGVVRFTPLRDQGGDTSFTVTASDGKATSAPATVDVHVEPQNDPPRATSARYSTDEDVEVRGTLVATDIDADPLTFAIYRAPVHGSAQVVEPAKGTFRYVPAENYNGSDTFEFSVKDPSGVMATSVVNITIRPVDDAPTAVSGSISCPFRGSATGRLQGLDPERQPITFRVVEQPSAGKVRLTDNHTGDFTFTTEGTYSGKVSFTFEVSDGSQTSLPIEEYVGIMSR